MITYIEKGAAMHQAILDEGFKGIYEHNNVWLARDPSEEVAINAFILAYDGLPAVKKEKRLALRDEYRNHLILIYPDAEEMTPSHFDVVVDMCFDIFRSVIGSSRSPNVDWQNVLDTRTARRNIRTEINDLTTIAEVQSYDVVNNPLWPVI